uniref:Uncharacterized protein n=1 Tax=Lotus japonicus TaxID=34305 RepID=I3SCE7_LOTJA|nr:unknown [Lotus japonicus]
MFIIQDLGSDHDTCNKQPMHIQGYDKRIRMPMCQPVYIHISNHET